MTRICTQRNYIEVGVARPGDRFVGTWIMPQWGPMTLLCVQPIEQFLMAVQWARDMADYMAGPLMVSPMESEDEWLRKLCIAIGYEGLHQWHDPEQQRLGRDLLVSIGVMKP